MYGYDDIIGGADKPTFTMLAGTLGAVMIIIYIIAIAFSIACYVLQSLGLYAIAKRRGHARPWLAWIPVANEWLIGRLSDQFQWVTKRRQTNRAKLLLYFNIGFLATLIICYILLFILTLNNISTITYDASTGFGILIILMVVYVALIASAVTYAVFYYIALYDIFTSCDPGKNVLFIVLSILFGIHPFFIFALRNKDLGMYPQYPPHNMYNQGGYNNYGGFNNNGGYNNYGNFNNNGGYNPNNYNQTQNDSYNQDNQNQ